MFILALLAGCDLGASGSDTTMPDDATPGGIQATPQVIFSSPFSIEPDGFSFRNYGFGYPEGDLTIAEVHQLFGDSVCATLESGVCIPTPAAQLWIDTMNNYMTAGHCAGFTVLSYRLFNDQLEQSAFTPNAVTTYDVLQEVPAMRAIAQNYVLQVLEEVWSKTVEGSPRQIIDELIRLQEPVDIGIFGPDNAGHSMVAYAVDKLGEDLYWIRVYDSNWPGVDTYIEVNYAENTWRYSMNGMTPSEDPNAWTGDAQSNSLMFIPLSAYNQPVACPFCNENNTTGLLAKRASLRALTALSPRMYVFISAGGDLLIVDPQGQKLGSEAGQLYTEIPGSSLIRLRGALFSNFYAATFPQPSLENGSGAYNMTFTSQPAASTYADWRVLGQGVGFSLENLDLTNGMNEQFSFIPDAYLLQMSYSPGGEQHPILKMFYQDNGVTYLIGIGDLDLQAGNTINFAVDDTNLITISGNGFSDDGVSLFIVRISSAGISIYTTNELYLPANAVLGISFTMWTEGGPVDFLTDLDGDGLYEDYLYLGNLGPAFLMKNLSPNEVVSLLTDLAPYMNSSETLDLVSVLSYGGFLPGDIGTILYTFMSRGMSLDFSMVSSLISSLDLSPDGIADLIFNLNLSDADLVTLLESLDLSPDVLELVVGRLAELEALEAQWLEEEFDNADGGYSGQPRYSAPPPPFSTTMTPTFPPTPTGMPTFSSGYMTTTPTGFPTFSYP
ncbi:MAG: hypothetical protein HY781_03915 [Chloroflexi bacterium]|nr:hypothetical protein [Chloroflexota bacterium]